MEEITLDSLIQEQKERIQQLHYKPSPPGCIGFSYYYYDDNACYQKMAKQLQKERTELLEQAKQEIEKRILG